MKKNAWNKKTKAFMESLGYHVTKTETWNNFAGVKNDLLGFADHIALNPNAEDGKAVVAIQTTSRSNISARYRKITDRLDKDGKPNAVRERAILWCRCNCSIKIIGWDNGSLRSPKRHPEDYRGKMRMALWDDGKDEFTFRDINIPNNFTGGNYD